MMMVTSYNKHLKKTFKRSITKSSASMWNALKILYMWVFLDTTTQNPRRYAHSDTSSNPDETVQIAL